MIPRTLAQNCGVNVIRTMTALQAKVYFLNITSLSHAVNLSIVMYHLCSITIYCSDTFSLSPMSGTDVIYLPLQHANGENQNFGIDGNTGEITDMRELGVSTILLFFAIATVSTTLFTDQCLFDPMFSRCGTPRSEATDIQNSNRSCLHAVKNR